MVCSLRPRFIITRTLRRLKMKSSATRPTSKCALNPPAEHLGHQSLINLPPATSTFKSRTSAKTRPVTAQLVSDQYWPRAINHLVGHLTHVAQCRDTEWQTERSRAGDWANGAELGTGQKWIIQSAQMFNKKLLVITMHSSVQGYSNYQ